MKLFVKSPPIFKTNIDLDGEEYASIETANDEFVNLGDLSRLMGKDPASLWDMFCLISASDSDSMIIVGPKMLIASTRMDSFFFLDSLGNVIDKNGKETGYSVGGPEGKTVGSWTELFMPQKWAEEVLLWQ